MTKVTAIWEDAFARVQALEPEVRLTAEKKLQKQCESYIKKAVKYAVLKLEHEKQMKALRNAPVNYFFWTSAPGVGADCFSGGLKKDDASALFLLDLFFQSVPKAWGSQVPGESIFKNAPNEIVQRYAQMVQFEQRSCQNKAGVEEKAFGCTDLTKPMEFNAATSD